MSVLWVIYTNLIIVFTFTILSINPSTSKENIVNNFFENQSLNPLLDDICSNLKKNAKEIGLEPLKLPDLLETYNQSFWIIGTMVEVYNLSNGKLYNLETLHRYGDSSISYGNSTLEVLSELEIDNIKVEYLLESSFNGHELHGILHGELKMLRIRFAASLDTSTLNITLKDISFPHPGKLDLSLETNKLLSWLINSVLKIVTTLFESLIMNKAQKVIQKAIEDYLKHFPPT